MSGLPLPENRLLCVKVKIVCPLFHDRVLVVLELSPLSSCLESRSLKVNKLFYTQPQQSTLTHTPLRPFFPTLKTPVFNSVLYQNPLYYVVSLTETLVSRNGTVHESFSNNLLTVGSDPSHKSLEPEPPVFVFSWSKPPVSGPNT